MYSRTALVTVSLFAWSAIGWAAPPPKAPKLSMQILYSFPSGVNPSGTVITDTSGAIYGTTSYGGEFGRGTVYRLTPPKGKQAQWTYTLLHSFASGSGELPDGGLAMDSSGNLYGVTYQSALNDNRGTVFKLVRPASGGAWQKNTLYEFQGGLDGANPKGGIVFGPTSDDGTMTIVGTTYHGGSTTNVETNFPGAGTIFRLVEPIDGSAPWIKTTLHSFAAGDGSVGFPWGGLIKDTGGNIYGTTSGANGAVNGTVFQLAPQNGWALSTLYTFGCGFQCIDGITPWGTLALDGSGGLVGTTLYGGAHAHGVLFRLTASTGTPWPRTLLHSFAGSPDGAEPSAGVTINSSGVLFGTTGNGGNANQGSIYRSAPGASAATVLYSFPGGAGGAGPTAGVIFGGSGELIGTTTSGGSNGGGVVFRLTGVR